MHRAEQRPSTFRKVTDRQTELRRLRRKLGIAKRFGRQEDVASIQKLIDILRLRHDFEK